VAVSQTSLLFDDLDSVEAYASSISKDAFNLGQSSVLSQLGKGYGSLEDNHRGKVSFSSYHLNSTHYLHD
jgi:hypothetical protein